MILEITRAVFIGAIPVALFTFVILQWSITSGRMNKFGGEQKLQQQHRAHAKKSRKNRSGKQTFAVGDLFHNKLGLDLLIEFFVNSLMNLVAAFVWFVTLPDHIRANKKGR